jgi:hypothetical protein
MFHTFPGQFSTRGATARRLCSRNTARSGRRKLILHAQSTANGSAPTDAAASIRTVDIDGVTFVAATQVMLSSSPVRTRGPYDGACQTGRPTVDASAGNGLHISERSGCSHAVWRGEDAPAEARPSARRVEGYASHAVQPTLLTVSTCPELEFRGPWAPREAVVNCREKF